MNFTSFDNIGLVRVLTFLKSHDREYLSGQDLSDILKISRVAVWKHIKKIRSLGYTIDSKQKLGYKLQKNTNLLLPWEIQDGLDTKYIGKRVYYFDSMDSTQMFASKISNDDEGTVVVSKKQTDGKGRLDRKWSSPPGGVWCSIIFHPRFEASSSTFFPLIAGIAITNTIEKFYNLDSKLKWPNDVTVDGKKVAGIIVDASMESNKISSIILGIGINFSLDVNKIEKSLRGSPNFYGVFSLSEENTNKIKFVQALFHELEIQYEKLVDGKTKDIVDDWIKKSSTLNKKVSVMTASGKISGIATKLDESGALIIKNGKKIHKIVAGDISYSN